MKKITIREIIKATGAQMIALGDMEEALNKEIWYVTQDSRETKEGVLFVARVGEVRDGHDFLPQCFANGVTACLSQKVVAPTNGAIVLLVPDTGKALLDLAAYYRSLFDIPFVSITGSVGKTTTKDMIASVLSQKFDTLWTETMSLPPMTNATMIFANVPADFKVPDYVTVKSVVTDAASSQSVLTAMDGTEYTLADDCGIVPYLTRNIVTLDDLTQGRKAVVWSDGENTATRIMVFAE